MDPKQIIINAFYNLIETTLKNERYVHMQISVSDDSRVFVCLCPMIADKVIIHEEFDNDSSFNNTKITTNESFIEGIKNIPSITYIGLREDPNDKFQLTELYKL